MSDYGHEMTEWMVEELEERLTAEYIQAVAEVQHKLEEHWRKFQIKDEIKRKALARGEITQAEYDRWRKGQMMMGKRWQEMVDTLAQDMHNTNLIAASTIRDFSYDAYALNHNYGTYEVEKSALVDTSYTLYDRHTVQALVRRTPTLLPPPGKKTQQRIDEGKDVLWNKKIIQSVALQGIIQGESIPQISKRLALAVGDSNRKAAIRNARTMMTGAENRGRVDSYKRAEGMGIEMKQVWVATLDGRTRHEHRQLDGQKVSPGRSFHIGKYTIRFPGDPQAAPEMVYNCRCTLIGQVKGIDYTVGDTSLRNNYKLGGMSYTEWKDYHFHFGTLDQVQIGQCKTVEEVSALLNKTNFFTSSCDLVGCDLDSAKSIAGAYERVLNEFPFMHGKIGGVTALDLGDTTYARNYMYGKKNTEVNTYFFGSFSRVLKDYEFDVQTGWHPKGTTAESVVVHELGHALDGLLTDAGMFGSGPPHYHTSSFGLRSKVAMSTGIKTKDMGKAVSTYGAKDEKEWFAECFAEYLTSANPRSVAKKFGEMLKEATKYGL